jgi:hypothetical protein
MRACEHRSDGTGFLKSGELQQGFAELESRAATAQYWSMRISQAGFLTSSHTSAGF